MLATMGRKKKSKHRLPEKYRTGPEAGEPKNGDVFIVLRIADGELAAWANAELERVWALPVDERGPAMQGVEERSRGADRRLVGFVRVGHKNVWGTDGKVIQGESVWPSDLVLTEEEFRAVKAAR